MTSATQAEAPLLSQEAKVPLGKVTGRIDHLAVDLQRGRLFVAELGNNTVGVVDLKTRQKAETLRGIQEPQGIGYEPSTDTVWVASGDDGTVHVLHGDTYQALGQIDLHDDADNIRIDPVMHRVYVGYGSGGLAVIDPATRAQVGNIPLNGHPEG
ncbi:MAG TPA: hypothetical protein VF678_07645, partial [bacterium]